MKARISKAEKALDREIEKEYYRQGEGIQIDLFAIPKIYNECKAALATGTTLPDAMKACIAKHRRN
jgi:hypothetical protein